MIQKWYTLIITFKKEFLKKMVSTQKQRLQITLSKHMVGAIEKISKERGLSKSLIIEMALNEYVKKGF